MHEEGGEGLWERQRRGSFMGLNGKMEERKRERESERKGASGRKMGPPRWEERMNADLARVN